METIHELDPIYADAPPSCIEPPRLSTHEGEVVVKLPMSIDPLPRNMVHEFTMSIEDAVGLAVALLDCVAEVLCE